MFNKLIAVLLLCCSFSVQAQQRPIKMVIPFGAGGMIDILSRRFADAIEQDTGRQILIESRPGAAGYIGLKHMAQNKTDEVLISILDVLAISNVILLHDDIVYDDFRYVTQIGTTTSAALAVKKGSPLKNIAAWRSHRGQPITVGINGLAGAHHYYNWVFVQQIPNTPVTEVAYKGVNDMLQNLIGGHIDAGWANLVSLEQQAEKGTIDIVAIIQPQRSETSPNIRTFAEQGITMTPPAKWILISNQSTDLATIQQIDRSVRKLMQDPKFVQLISTTSLVVEPKLADQAAASQQQSLRQQAKFIEWYKSTQRK